MLSQLEQACKTYSTEFSYGLIEFDSDWQRIFVTALTFHLDQAISYRKYEVNLTYGYSDMSNQKSLTQNFDVNVDEPCGPRNK